MRKLILVLYVAPILAIAEEDTSNLPEGDTRYEEEKVRFYSSPEERREAGLGRQITKWLKVSGLLELDKEFEKLDSGGDRNAQNNQKANAVLQLGFDIQLLKWLNAEILYENERGDTSVSRIEEAYISAEFGDFGIDVGNLTIPFGEFYSHFIIGPFLEFGETTRDAVVIDYSVNKNFEFTTFVIDSKIKKSNTSNKYDWGTGINFTSKTDALRMGISYLSDLAESDEQFLNDANNIYAKQVSAWSAYSLLGINKFELSGEVVIANQNFREFDNNSNKPFAYNIELAYFPTRTTEFALRWEGSDEFAEQPKQQYGISASWRPMKNISISTEYLHAKYKDEFFFNDNNEDINARDLFAARLSIEF